MEKGTPVFYFLLISVSFPLLLSFDANHLRQSLQSVFFAKGEFIGCVTVALLLLLQAATQHQANSILQEALNPG